MAQVKLDRARFLGRLQTLSAAWTWDFDVVLLIMGKASDEAQQFKTAAMHHWLLGVEIPDTAVALSKNGRAVFLASQSKSEYLRQLDGPEVSCIVRSSGSAFDSEAMKTFTDLWVTADTKVGMLQKETHAGPFAGAFIGAIGSLASVEVRECREAISGLLAPKDEEELGLSRKAAHAAQLLMRDSLMQKLMDVLDEEHKKTHKDLCGEVEQYVDDEALMAQWGRKHGLDPGEMDLFCVSLQSSAPFDLRHTAEPNAAVVPMQGSYLMSIGMKYAEYSACISRTMLVDPTAEHKKAYTLAHKLQKQIISALVPGAVFRDIYLAARARVLEQSAVLVERFVKNVGFAMGLEFKDPMLVLSEKSEQKVLAGMVFCISVGFSADNGMDWAVWLSDTVVLPRNGGPCELLTSGCSSEEKDMWFEAGVDEAAPAAPAQTPPVQPSGGRGKPKSPAKPEQVKPAQAKRAAAKKGAAGAKPLAKEPVARQERASRGSQGASGKSPTKTRSSRAAPMAIDVSHTKLKETRTRQKNEQTKKDWSQLQRFEDEQLELRKQKLEEIRERLSGMGAQTSRGGRGGPSKLSDCQAYATPSAMPKDATPNGLKLDLNAEALLAPICGVAVPFHVRTIKNMSKSLVDRTHFLRVNFFTPGQGKSEADYPVVNGNRLYVRELCFRSQNQVNFDKVMREFKEAQKRTRQRDLEGECKGTTAEVGSLQCLRAPPCLRDLHVRPSLSTGRRCVGTLEAHANGFRFSARGGADKLDILYSQVKHAIFEACDNTPLVLIHLHFVEPVMLGKKKSQDIQFYAEAVNMTEDLSQARGGSHYDPDEILEEQREREMRERLNKMFHDFVKKVESIQTCNVEFDIPVRELAFEGVPNKSVITLCPCKKVLSALQDWPPFILDLSEVDVVIFERAMAQLREFDIVFVKKDYEQSPVRITTIPTVSLKDIKPWLHDMKMTWYSCAMNMQWPLVMKEITKDPGKFVEDGCWDAWFPEDGSGESGSEAAGNGVGSEESDWKDSEADDESDEAAGGEDDSDFDAEDDDDVESDAPSDDASGVSWDELEREAEKDDRRGDLERSGAGRAAAAAPPRKRARR